MERRLLVLAASLGLLAVPTGAQDEAPPDLHDGTAKVGEPTLWTQLGFYDNGDQGDGNPFLDETLTVIEPLLLWDHQVTEDWGYAIKLSYDNVSAASIERLSKFPEQSGASGDYYIGLNYASRHRLELSKLFTWNVGASVEYDYRSFGGGIGRETQNAEYGSTDKWNLTTYFDQLDMIRFNGVDEGTDTRLSITGTWARSQPVSAKWNATLSALVGFQNGFLSTPYNAVVLEDDSLAPNPNLVNNARGIEVTEVLPDTRIRGAVKLVGRRWMGPGRALEIGGRLYADDWGIAAVSVEPRYQWITSDKTRLRLRYRYYQQTEADDYGTTFLGTTLADAPGFRTQDSDLGAFYSHTFGTRFDWMSDGAPLWSVDFNYTIREDGLNHIYATIGRRWSL